MGEDETVGEAFFERNQAVFLLLAVLNERGHVVGYRVDEDEEWPVVFAETSMGQIAWHVPREELPEWLEERDMPWDGHTTEEKHRRMQLFSESLVSKADRDDARFQVESLDDGYVKIEDANGNSLSSTKWCQEADAVQLAEQIFAIVKMDR